MNWESVRNYQLHSLPDQWGLRDQSMMQCPNVDLRFIMFFTCWVLLIDVTNSLWNSSRIVRFILEEQPQTCHWKGSHDFSLFSETVWNIFKEFSSTVVPACECHSLHVRHQWDWKVCMRVVLQLKIYLCNWTVTFVPAASLELYHMVRCQCDIESMGYILFSFSYSWDMLFCWRVLIIVYYGLLNSLPIHMQPALTWWFGFPCRCLPRNCSVKTWALVVISTSTSWNRSFCWAEGQGRIME